MIVHRLSEISLSFQLETLLLIHRIILPVKTQFFWFLVGVHAEFGGFPFLSTGRPPNCEKTWDKPREKVRCELCMHLGTLCERCVQFWSCGIRACLLGVESVETAVIFVGLHALMITIQSQTSEVAF